MARITHTRDRESHLRFGGHDGVEFPGGERVIDVDDDHAEWAVETFPDVEYADSDADAAGVEAEPEDESEAEAEDEGDDNE